MVLPSWPQSDHKHWWLLSCPSICYKNIDKRVVWPERFLNSCRSPGKLWYSACFCCWATSLPKAIGVQRRQKEHNPGDRGCWHDTLSSSVSVIECDQAAVGDCALEKRRMLLRAMEKGGWCGKSLMQLLIVGRKDGQLGNSVVPSKSLRITVFIQGPYKKSQLLSASTQVQIMLLGSTAGFHNSVLCLLLKKQIAYL